MSEDSLFIITAGPFQRDDSFLDCPLRTAAYDLKGGYLDFSHLTELKKMYITEIYMKKQYKTSITNNHKIKEKYIFLMVFP